MKKKNDAADVMGNVEDLSMPINNIPANIDNIYSNNNDILTAKKTEPNEENLVDSTTKSSSIDWFEDPQESQQKPQPEWSNNNILQQNQETSRFQQQLSPEWNNRIVENTDKLSPLSSIMERLAILEEERTATEKRLEEEFRVRTEMEEKFYAAKRKLLEEAALQVQSNVFMDTNTLNDNNVLLLLQVKT